MKENRINQTLSAILKNITDNIDVNTIVGSSIKTEDGVIIPVAKVTLCLLTGGGEYGKIKIFSKNDELPFSAGNGSIISIKPCGFLVKNNNEDYKVLSVGTNNFDGILDKATDFLKDITLQTSKEVIDEE